jgi:hypothetical protein
MAWKTRPDHGVENFFPQIGKRPAGASARWIRNNRKPSTCCCSSDLNGSRKSYTATTGLIVTGPQDRQRPFYLPFVSLPLHGDPTAPRLHWAALANCEIHAAAWVGVRAGFNPGEALDFLLGSGLDLFADDLGRRATPP